MKAKLFEPGAEKGDFFVIEESAVIGRSRSSDIRLESKAVSTEHARIYFDADSAHYFVEDLDSLNGTQLDGVTVTRPEPLDRLHILEFGGDGREFVFQAIELEPPESTDESSPAPAASGTAVEQELPELPGNLAGDDGEEAPEPVAGGTSVEREMPALPQQLVDATEEDQTLPVSAKSISEPEAPAPPPTLETPGTEAPFYLQLHEPADTPAIPLPIGNRVVGRAGGADITVESRAVSRRHALLAVKADRVTIQDLGSRNHTFVNGEQVTGEIEVEAGSEIRFGELTATLLAAGERE